MNSVVTYVIPITAAIIIGFTLLFYFTHSYDWPYSIIIEFIELQSKDRDKIQEMEEQAGKDKFGISAIYPSAANILQEQIWYANWDDKDSRTLSKEQNDPLDSSFRIGGAGTPKVTINGNGTATVYGSSPRIYVFGEWKNVEITVYVKYSSPEDLKSVSIHGRSNHHKDCGFGGYTVRFGGVKDENDGISWIKKEPLHGIYSDRIGSVYYSIPINKWVGLKVIVRDIDGGKKVSVEGYVDDEMKTTTGRTFDSNMSNSNRGQWNKILHAIDDGMWPGMGQDKEDREIMKECIGKGDNISSNFYKPFTKTTEAIWLRTNGAEDVKYKWFSVREIKGQ
jgi:hypothetical protein